MYVPRFRRCTKRFRYRVGPGVPRPAVRGATVGTRLSLVRARRRPVRLDAAGTRAQTWETRVLRVPVSERAPAGADNSESCPYWATGPAAGITAARGPRYGRDCSMATASMAAREKLF